MSGPLNADERRELARLRGWYDGIVSEKIAAWAPAPGRQSVYISGPMRGYFEDNYAAFNAAALAWRRAGWEVRNPAEHFDGDHTRTFAEYMRVDIADLLAVNAIALLPGWEQSTGARTELLIAQTLGLTVYYADVPGQPFIYCPEIRTLAFRK